MKVKRISDELHEKVLGRKPNNAMGYKLGTAESNLKRFGLDTAIDRNEVVNLPLPKWAEDYETTLSKAVALLGKPTLNRLDHFVDRAVPKLPSKPHYRAGWQRFDGTAWVKSGMPTSSDAMVLDFETAEIVEGLWLPVCCCVWSGSEGWFVWCKDWAVDISAIEFPMGQVIVGHNVAYDRAFLASEYRMQDSGNRFFDTMSAWIAARGFTNQQRNIVALAEKDDDFLAPAWVEQTGKNGLADVYEFYCGKELDKGVRSCIVELGMAYMQDNIGEVLWYCLKDVQATFEVFTHVYPELRRSQPSEVSWTGQLLLGNTWLPLSSTRWSNYYDTAETKYQEVLSRVDMRLEEVAQAVLASPTKYQLEALDWTPAKTGKNKGQPKWYRDCKGKPSAGSRIAGILLSVKWMNEICKLGFETDENGRQAPFWYTDSFGKLPHPEKRGKNLTDLFMQKMVKTVEDGTMTAEGGLKELLLDIISTVNWTSLRKRVKAVHIESPEGFPVTLPQITVTGTITRRCKDNVWQVAANPKSTRIGTELKSMVEAPEGYKLVGADVDS